MLFFIALFFIGTLTAFAQYENSSESRNNEFLLDTNVAYISCLYSQNNPAIVFDGTNYLVVWKDNRRGYSDIYGARVNQSGVMLDSAGFIIAGGECSNPVVSFDGTNYLVVWEDYIYCPHPWEEWYRVRGRQVSTSGTVIGNVITIVSTSWYWYSLYNPSVAFGDTNYLVVWGDNRNGYSDIYGARVTQSGIVLDPSGIAISTEVNTQWFPSITFDSTNYFVIWSDRRGTNYDIYGARINRSGVVLDTAGISISTATDDQGAPSIAFDDINYMVTWNDKRNGWNNPDIYGSRVSQAGEVLDPAGIAICTAALGQENSDISFDRMNYMVVWSDWRNGLDNQDIYGTRVSQTGKILDSTGIAVATMVLNQGNPAIGFDGTNYTVAWDDDNNSSSHDICGTRVNPTGVVIDTHGVIISTMAHYQYHSSVASNRIDYMVVWEDYRKNTDWDIFGVRVDSAGIVIDPNCISISTSTYNQNCPAIAFDSTNYLTVWQDQRNDSGDIYGARVSPTGIVLDLNGIPISTAPGQQKNPAIAFDNTNYLAVWQDQRNDSNDVYGARVNAAGEVLDATGIPISTAAGWQGNPAIGFDGVNYMVVWENDYGNSNIHGARVSLTGEVLDSIPIAITPYGKRPTIAFDGTNYLVVWEIYAADWYYLYCARVAPSGVLIDTNSILIDHLWYGYGWWNPSVAFDGTHYLVVWDMQSWGIKGALVSPAGTVDSSFAVAGLGNLPTLARGYDNQMLITYSSWTDSINMHPANTMRIWGKFYPFVGLEEKISKKPKAKCRFRIYPNPARRTLDIEYPFITSREKIIIRIYNAIGRLVTDFLETTSSPSSAIHWNCTDKTGNRLPSGVYFIQIESNGHKQVEKVILLR